MPAKKTKGRAGSKVKSSRKAKKTAAKKAARKKTSTRSKKAATKSTSAPKKTRRARKTEASKSGTRSKKTGTRKRTQAKGTPARAEIGPALDSDLGTLGIGSQVIPPWQRKAPTANHTPTPTPASHQDLAEQIRELEAKLESMIHQGEEELATPPAEPTKGERDESSPADINQDTYFEKNWGRLRLRDRAEQVDDFGLDPRYERRIRPLVDLLYRRYFRVESKNINRVQGSGRCLVIANHSGTLPFDGLMLRAAFRLDHPAQRELRWLAEDYVYYVPFLGTAMNRLGAVRACPENAARLLAKDELVAVFPEGVFGMGKLFSERYKLQRFGRGGFIRLALRTQTPVVPACIVGAEEANPLLFRLETLGRSLGLPYLPVTPTFPWLGPLGLLPAPVKWKVCFADPLELSNYGPEAADDHVLVGRLARQVQNRIQDMLDAEIRNRKSIFFG